MKNYRENFFFINTNMKPTEWEEMDYGKRIHQDHLDISMSMIPDQPTRPDLARAADSNSLLTKSPLFPTCTEQTK